MFSEITKNRLSKFKSIKRSYYAFCILFCAFVISLFSDLLANEKPLLIYYEGKTYFPIFFFYSGKEFGQEQSSVANYSSLYKNQDFMSRSFLLRPLYPYGPFQPYLEQSTPPPHLPSARHWLGTDRLGRDILARILYGFRTGILFALCLIGIMGVLGVCIGGIQGYLGGRFDLISQRLIELWSALPFLYVVILIGSLYGRSFSVLVFVISLFNWIGLSYYMRAEFLKGKKQTYVQVARVLGLRSSRIFFRHILPNSLTSLITILPFGLISGITTLTALDFLGFGLPPPTPSWGELLKQGLDIIREFPHITVVTTSVFFITLLLAVLIGEGAREAFDPRAPEISKDPSRRKLSTKIKLKT